MTIYKQQDIVLVKFIFSEGAGFKKRPALVVSGDRYNQSREEVVIAAVTSNVGRLLTGDTLVKDWKKANLLFPSVVCGVLQTIKNNLIERKLGALTPEDFGKVQANFKTLFGF
mgnify:CR=1 FL=1